MFGIYLVLFVAGLILLRNSRRGHKPLPPGPTPFPVLGNLLQHSTSIAPWIQYFQWHKKYGTIVSFALGEQTIISLGSREHVRHLLERKARKYSSRPQLIVLSWLMNNMLHGFSPYGPKWEALHRVCMALTNPLAIEACGTLTDAHSTWLLHELLSKPWTPQTFSNAMVRFITVLVYGQEVNFDREDVFHNFDFQEEFISHLMTLDDVVIELFPSLAPLLTMFGHFKRTKRQAEEFHQRLLRTFKAKAELARRSKAWNYTKEMDKLRPESLSDDHMDYLRAELELVSTVSTSIMLNHLMTMCVEHPEAILKAQTELDMVIGKEKMPNISDRERLPYLNALILELFRHNAFGPLGFPRATSEDDEYMGYHIPKGTVIITNQFYLNNDESIYDNPRRFDPDRWIKNPDLRRPFIFGSGKRRCPGQPFTDYVFFMMVSRLLWAYDIRSNRNEAERSKNHQLWLVGQPEEQDVNFSVRSASHKKVIEEQWDRSEKNNDVILDAIHRSRLTMC